MIDSISSSDISNEISMMRSAFGGTFLVVEGATDCRLYSKFTDHDNVRIIVAHSKNNVIQSVTECRNRRRDGSVIGFVDKDMDPVLGKKRAAPIFTTDERDMESTLLASPALKDLLAEYGDGEKLSVFEKKYGPLSERVAKAAAPIGALMYVSYRRGMNLSFKELDHSLFVDSRSLNTDVTKMVAAVYANSMAQRYPRGTIAELVEGMLVDVPDLWLVARGHDAVTILKIGLKFSFGSYNSRNITDGEVGGALRLAYNWEYFKKTKLYGDSKEWSEKNHLALWIP